MLLMNAGKAVPPGPPGPWSPASLSTLIGWYDASDSGTITNIGGKASQWNDKSANANNLTQGTDANRPLIGTGINSLGTLQFGLLGAFSKTENNAITGFPGSGSGWSFGCALQYVAAPNSNGVYDVSTTTSTNDTGMLMHEGASMIVRTQGIGPSSIAFTDTASAHVFSGDISTTHRLLVLDGTAGTASATTQTSANSTHLRVGSLYSDVYPFTGYIGELVLFSGGDTTDRQTLEGYLAWKWGTQGSLPLGHPYKSAAP